jgi:hypothetical protein
MIKHQNIFFDNKLDFNTTGGGIIENDTETINLFFHDHCNSNSLCLIGDSLEWKPIIWMEFEREKLEKLKEINILSLLGDLTALQSYCKILFPNVAVNYYAHNLSLQIMPIRATLSTRPALPAHKRIRDHVFRTSIGTMRLNRYILLKFSLKHNLNLFHPAVTYNVSKDFEYQISQCAKTAMQQPTDYKQNRIFTEEMGPHEFNTRQLKLLCNSYINFVATFPNTDWLKYCNDEKYFDTILTKTVPFMLCEKNSNTNIRESTLGFLPYTGFNFENDGNDNPVLRWTSLLEDNTHIFKDKEQVKELYDANQRVIEHNYNRLVNTDWESERSAQFNRLPTFIKDYLNFKK